MSGGVINGQAVDAPITNNAFLKRNGDDFTQGQLGLSADTTVSGTAITDTQAEINGVDTFIGRAPNAGKASLPGFLNNNGFTATDALSTRVDSVSQKFHATAGHKHSGAPGDGAQIPFNNLSGTQLIGYAVRGTNITGVTGSSTDVSSYLTGQTPSTGSTVKGVVVTAGANYIYILDVNGDSILDASGNKVFARLTYATAVWTLSYYTLTGSGEVAYSFGASTTIEWYYQRLFDETDRPVYSDLFVLQSDQVAGQVPTGSFTVQGKLQLGLTAVIQPVGSAASQGTSNGQAAAADHVHRGVSSVASDGGALLYGGVTFKGLNSATVSQTGNQITIDVPAAAVNNLAAVLAAGNSAGTNPINMNSQSVNAQGPAEFVQGAPSANPASGRNKLYFKADGLLYKLSSAGVETAIEGQAASLASVLGVGNSAGTFNINMNGKALLAVGFEELQQIATPATPASGFQRLYAKADGKLYSLDSTGTETQVGTGAGGGGGGSAVQWLNGDTNAVDENVVQGLQVLDFSQNGDQEIWAQIVVPSTYVAGAPITLQGAKVATAVTTGNIQMRTQSYLIRGGTTILGSLGTAFQSTNNPLTANATANTLQGIASFDLTTSAGAIGGTAVQALDVILIRLYRDTASEATIAAAPARVVRNSFIPKYTA